METADNLGTQIGQKGIRAALAIMGLFIVRGVVSILPMVRNAEPVWHRSWFDLFTSSGGRAVGFDSLLINPGSALNTSSFTSNQLAARLAQQWASLLQNNSQIMQAMSQARSSTPTIQAFILATLQNQYGSYASRVMHRWLSLSHWAIFPSTLVHAIVDTLILAVLTGFGLQLRKIFLERSHYPAIGQIMNLALIATVVVFAYQAYQGIFYPLLGPSWVGFYGWFFLAAGLFPLSWAIVLVSQNLDSFSTAIFHVNKSALSSGPGITAGGRCTNWGQNLESGMKFCSSCGSEQKKPTAVNKWCPSCGAELKAGAKFCGRCGRGME